MSAAFTPGPWTQCDRIVLVCPPSHKYWTWIADVSVGGQSKAEMLANARLIAAAPDLLEALQGFVNHGTCFDKRDMTAARAAIAKAIGGAA